jgi:Kinesin motor domain
MHIFLTLPSKLITGFELGDGKYAVCISFFELYQDRIYDLLEDSPSLIQKRKHLPLKRDVHSGRRYVSGLRKIYADSAEVWKPVIPFVCPSIHSGLSMLAW